MIAWGQQCSEWDDSVDWAALEAADFGPIPDEKFVMTTWHENESLSEVLWFATHAAMHPEFELPNKKIVHISEDPRETELVTAYMRGFDGLG